MGRFVLKPVWREAGGQKSKVTWMADKGQDRWSGALGVIYGGD